jgi:3-deoxy-D-manno-octulosonic-acid transferase
MIYNLFLILFAFFMGPKIIWQKWRKGKKVPDLKERLGFHPPVASGSGMRIWIHAVSLGEMKAAQPLAEYLLQSDPTAQVLITTSTTTGYEEACRLFAEKALIRYFPLDFSWTMHRWVRSFRPRILIFVEGDVWPNLLYEAKRQMAHTALVSGKISEKSAQRFSFFTSVSRRLFDSLDLICVQNEEYRNRFARFVNCPIHISGNLKLDIEPVPLDPSAIRRRFALHDNQRAITISCTHAPEEKDLLFALRPLWDHIPDLVIFLAPRHPERFDTVASILHQMKIPFCRWNGSRVQEPLILVDAMGQLPTCYCVSSSAIIAGSFASHTGGHNVLEPCLYGCPVLFGLHMHAQMEFARIALQYGVGRQINEDLLVSTLLEFFDSLPLLRANILRLVEKNRGSTLRTARLLQNISIKNA